MTPVSTPSVFHTSGGQLLFYKITNNLSLHELLVNTDGGMEETWIAESDGYVTSRTEIKIGAGVTPVGVFPVPEPTPALLLFGGLAVLAAYARRQPGRRSAS